jgi:hypothetical protein
MAHPLGGAEQQGRPRMAIQWLVVLMTVTVAIAFYHLFVLPRTMRFGLVDVNEVYRLKEKQLLDMVTKPTVSDADKQGAIEAAAAFAKALPAALEQLPIECGCFVLVRSAVAAPTGNTVDLTPLLKKKVGVAP